jgi:hypothetical protein
LLVAVQAQLAVLQQAVQEQPHPVQEFTTRALAQFTETHLTELSRVTFIWLKTLEALAMELVGILAV